MLDLDELNVEFKALQDYRYLITLTDGKDSYSLQALIGQVILFLKDMKESRNNSYTGEIVSFSYSLLKAIQTIKAVYSTITKNNARLAKEITLLQINLVLTLVNVERKIARN